MKDMFCRSGYARRLRCYNVTVSGIAAAIDFFSGFFLALLRYYPARSACQVAGSNRNTHTHSQKKMHSCNMRSCSVLVGSVLVGSAVYRNVWATRKMNILTDPYAFQTNPPPPYLTVPFLRRPPRGALHLYAASTSTGLRGERQR